MSALNFNSSKFNLPGSVFRGATKVAAGIDSLLQNIRDAADVGLHLGAGSVNLPGMINCDLHDERADRKIDATDLSEFADGSVCLIETHHMIEHLSFSEALLALTEWKRALKPGGLLVITCPDLTAVCKHWLRLIAQRDSEQNRNDIDYALKMFFGSQENVGMFHKSGYDAAVMQRTLSKLGFNIKFSHTPYQIRTTPSLLTIAQRI